MMNCQLLPREASGLTTNGYQYHHDETAAIRLRPLNIPGGKTPPWSLESRVSIESTSTLQSTAPIFRLDGGSWDISRDAVASGTPFSGQVLGTLARFPIQRLLIRVGDVAVSSGGIGNITGRLHSPDDIDAQQMLQEERSGGPSGTFIQASFVHSPDQNGNDYEHTRKHYEDQYAYLLRHLLDSDLFPPCGAPLDSLRVRKHGHSTIVRSRNVTSINELDTSTEIIDVESFLSSDASTFCNPGIHSLLLSREGGWGAAASNGACHSIDTRGMFDSLFSSSPRTLSELLLGSSADDTTLHSSEGGKENNRRSIWIDLQISHACFGSSGQNRAVDCSVKVTRGASYRIGLPLPAPLRLSGKDHGHTLKVSLGDLLLGQNSLQRTDSSESERRKAYPCPLTDSSRILVYLPTGYAAIWKEGFGSISRSSVSSLGQERVELDVLASKSGYIDLDAPFADIHRVEENNTDDKYLTSSVEFGISRTIQRPLGVSSSGTLVTVLRYDQLQRRAIEQTHTIEVRSLDVLPGALIKPKLHTLKMTLYEGGGSGKEGFVPPAASHDIRECSTSNSHESYKFESFCRTNLGLAELQDYNLFLHADGTLLLERTVHLRPDSSFWMMLDFDEAYLPFQKFPSDANRGIDLLPSRATFTPLSKLSPSAAESSTLYTPTLLLVPPVPDMSMPFNVISLSCTLWAFALGSLLNILVRRGTESVKRELTGEKEKTKIEKLKEKIREKGRKLKQKLWRSCEKRYD